MKKFYLVILITFISLSSAFGQYITAGPDDTICPPEVATLTGAISTTLANPAPTLAPGTVASCDDCFSNWVPLGFTFNFYGTNYTQCLISSNGYITFAGAGTGYTPGGGSGWAITVNLPNPGGPRNAIMTPWQDNNPALTTTDIIRYKTIGTAPNRIFIVEYLGVGAFGCGATICFGSQIHLYETTNVIETHILKKDICASWNSGRGVHGIQNLAGTLANIVPGRNGLSAPWNINVNPAAVPPSSPTPEGRRWTPTGATTYAMATIPFQPVYMPLTLPTGTTWAMAGGPVIATSVATINVSPLVATNYVFSVPYTTCGATTFIRDTVRVHIGNLPITMSPDVSICLGDTANLTATTTALGVTMFTWTPSSSLDSPTGGSVNAFPSATTTYVVSGSNGSCVNTDSVVVTILPLPDVTFIPAAPFVCETQSTDITVTSANPLTTYAWTANTTLIAGAATSTATVQPTVNNTYYSVTITDANGCSNTDSVMVQYYPQPIITVTPAAPDICPGNSTSLTGGGAVSYTWSGTAGTLSALAGGTITATPTIDDEVYTVIGTDANGCIDSTTVTVNWYIPPTVTVNSADPSVCPATSTTLSASGASNYVWSPALGLSSTVIANPTTTLSAPQTYTVIGTDANGCRDTNTITIGIYDLPNVNFTADNFDGCSPVAVNFANNSTIPSGTISSYNWFFEGHGSSSLTNPSQTFVTPGAFDVLLIATSDNGCIDSLRMSNMINVYGYPTAAFTADPLVTNIGDPLITFLNSSSLDAVNCYWTFGDSVGTSTNCNPFYEYNAPGFYTVTLITSTINGCSDTTSIQIEVQDISEIFIPNSFTPDGDGLNDSWFPVGRNLNKDQISINVIVFNRWGQEVYNGTTSDKPWNGKDGNKSVDCQQGTYAYYVYFKNEKGKETIQQGTVNLIR